MDEETKKVLSRLESLCSKSEYCISDVRTKALKALGGDSSRAAEVVESLLADAYVDEHRYAAAFAREKSSLTGWGPVKISFALRGKGIPQEVISGAMEEIDGEAADARLRRLLAAKAKTLEGDPQARLKLIKYALSRGYEYSQVEKAL